MSLNDLKLAASIRSPHMRLGQTGYCQAHLEGASAFSESAERSHISTNGSTAAARTGAKTASLLRPVSASS